MRINLRRFDFILLACTVVMSLYGIAMVYSATLNVPTYESYPARQLIYVLVGLALLVATAAFDYRLLTALQWPLLGEDVLITGAGPIGLVNVLCARAAGAGVIAVVETHKNRLSMAKECGATHSIETFDRKEQLEQVHAITDGTGFDVVIECSGAGPAAQMAVEALKPGGTLVFVGLFSQLEVPMDLNAITQKELTFKGVFRYRNTYPTAIDLISSKQIDVKPLITKRFPWEQVKDAMDCAHKEASSQIKVMTEW